MATFAGIDVRQSGSRVVFRALLMDSTGTIITTGTGSLRLYELQSDGTLKSYDFNDNTFKTTALTTETLALTHRTGNNATVNTGLWTAALATVTGFTKGNVYFARVDHSSAYPTIQTREWQYGGVEGDLVAAAGADNKALVSSDSQDLSATLSVNSKNIAGQAAALDANNLLKVDAEDWKGGVIPAVNVTGVPKVDIIDVLGSAPTATAAGVLDVNAKNLGGTAQTGRDVGASVLISSGSGAGQLDVTGGVVRANLAQILGTALTETAGQIAAAFKKFFNVGVAVLDTTSVNQTGDSYARLGAAGAGLTALGDTRIAHLDADVSSRSTYAGGAVASVTGAVGSVTANVNTNANATETAIKAKTDNLPAAPAATGDAMTLTTGERTTLAGVLWNTLTSALTTAGSIGKRLVDFVTTLVYVAPDNTDIAAIRATTDGLVQTAGKLWVLDSNGNAIVSATAADIVTAMAAHVTEGAYTWDDVFRLMLAAESGKLDGAGTTTVHIRDTADTKNRVTATVDSNGNRTAVTRNLT